MKNLSVTVVIPTYRPDGKLKKLLSRLERQTRRPERILIINTEEQYFSWQAVEGIRGVSVLHIEKKEFDHDERSSRSL